jgi:hypothetical protein
MRFLILIHLDENELGALPAREASDLNAAHLDLNETLKASGNFIVAEALEPARTTQRVRVRGGKLSVVDGPYTEAKEMVAGFYFIEARDMEEATAIASRIPSAAIGTIEVRPARQLHVDGRVPRWGSDPVPESEAVSRRG